MTIGLLEQIAEQHDVLISDLREADLLPAAFRALLDSDLERFSLSDWSDALWYLTGEPQAFQSIAQVQAYLDSKIKEAN